MSEPRFPLAGAAFKDRSARLVLFGAVSVAIGGVCVLFGLLYLALALTSGRLLGAETLPVEPRAYVMGAMLYFLLGYIPKLLGNVGFSKARSNYIQGIWPKN